RSTRLAHEAQVIPPISSSISAPSGDWAGGVVMMGILSFERGRGLPGGVGRGGAGSVPGAGPARRPCLGHHPAGDQVRRGEQGRQQQAVQGHPRACPARLRTAEYPASETAASTAASSTSPSAEMRSTPVSWLTSTSCTPGSAPTSSRTDISQWPQVMPVTWNWVVVVLMVVSSIGGTSRSYTPTGYRMCVHLY